MAEIYQLIASALTGSLATTITTKYLEARGKKKEFQRDLKKTFFVSKLKCAEDIYSQLTIAYGGLHHTIVLLKLQRNDVSEMDDFKELAKANLAERASKAIQQVDGALNSTAFAYGLYFGNKNDTEFLSASEKAHIAASEISSVVGALIDAIYPNGNSGLSTQEQKIKYDQAVIAYQKEFDRVIGIYEEMKSLLQIRLRDLHDHYKGYNLNDV